MTTFPYPPSQPSGDWQVTLPGDASIGELLVYQSESAVPTSVFVPDSTGSAAIVHRISGSGGIGSRYVLRCHFGSGLTPPTMPYSGGFRFWPYQNENTTVGDGSGIQIHGTSGQPAPIHVVVDTLVVTRPRAGAIEYAFNIVSGTYADFLEGTVVGGSGAIAYWAGAAVFNDGVADGSQWLQSNYQADTGAPNTFTGGNPDAYIACLAGPDWPYPYFTGGTPAP